MAELRAIPGFPGYRASTDGRIWSNKSNRWLKTRIGSHGYPQTDLAGCTRTVHGLIAATYLGARPEGLEVRHLNGNPLDSRAENLAYGTSGENKLDTVRHGTNHWASKTHCPRGHEYSGKNLRLYRGKRYCRACNNGGRS